MSERRERSLGKITGIVRSVKDVLAEPINYIQRAYWEMEQEVGPIRARTIIMRRGGVIALFPVSSMSLGVILGAPLLTALGGLAAADLGVSAVGTWIIMKLKNNDGIQRVINSPRQPRLFPHS